MAEAYIVAAARTAGGRKGGRLAGWHPVDLAASVLDALVERSGAEQVYTVHGYTEDFARHLRKRGIKASALEATEQLALAL